MTESELKARFNLFAVGIYQLTTKFPNAPVYRNTTIQLLKASSSTAANYHAACRAKSKPDFINKFKIVEEELDESIFWMNYVVAIDKKWAAHTEFLLKEGNELLAITVASINTAKGNKRPSSSRKSEIRNPKSEIQNQILNLKSAIFNSYIDIESSDKT